MQRWPTLRHEEHDFHRDTARFYVAIALVQLASSWTFAFFGIEYRAGLSDTIVTLAVAGELLLLACALVLGRHRSVRIREEQFYESYASVLADVATSAEETFNAWPGGIVD